MTLKNLFRKRVVPPPFDIEKAVGHYLLTLPRCTSRVMVVSRRFQDQRFKYGLTVDTVSVAAWAENLSWSNNVREQAAAQALQLWLRAADLTDRSVSYIDGNFFKVLCYHHEKFLKMPNAQVYCYECSKFVEDVTTTTTDLPMKEIFTCWRREMRCPEGHLMFQEETGAHFSRRGTAEEVLAK